MSRLQEMDCDCNDSFICPRCWAIAKIEEQAAQLTDVSRLESAFVRIAKAVGVTSPLALIAHAENDQENYAEVLARYIENREATRQALKEWRDETN